jgi:fructosamine-3-kinase
MAEAVALTALIRAAPSVIAPHPLNVGRLLRVGNYGPGAFLLLELMDLVPFGASRVEVQKRLGDIIADMHLSTALDHRHQNCSGFTVHNFLGFTLMRNTWDDDWQRLLAKRLIAYVEAPFRGNNLGLAPLNEKNEGDAALGAMAARILSNMRTILMGAKYSQVCSTATSG